MEFASGDCDDQSNTLMSFSCFYADKDDSCFESLSFCSSQFSFFLINHHCADDNKALWYILTILAAFKLSVKYKVPNPYFGKQLQMWTFTEFNSPLDESISVGRPDMMNERTQKQTFEKICSNCNPIFFCPSESFFDVFFWTVAVSSLLRNFTSWASKRFLMSHDIFRLFLRKIASALLSAMINEDSSQTSVKSSCFSSLFAQSHDLTDHRRFLRQNSVLPTYLQMSSAFSCI